MTSVGEMGERLVSRWLETQGYKILQQRWRCRCGEIDLIALSKLSDVLVFIEVKTRSQGNWDADGRLAITKQKQIKLNQSAAIFLVDYPQYADLSCRFDVALVNCQKYDPSLPQSATYAWMIWESYQLTLKDYIEAAFDSSY